jgi:hypothetical protein
MMGFKCALLSLVAMIILSVLMYMKGADDKTNELTAKYQADYIQQTDQTRLANQALHDYVADLDTQHTKELFDAQENIDSILADVRARKRRLFVTTKTPVCAVPDTPKPASMDYVTGRAELDRHTSENLIRLTSRGDTAIRQLTACQAYIIEVNKALNGAKKGISE